MVALVVLLFLLAIFGGLGFAVHFLWWVLAALVVLWLIGFFVERPVPGRRRRWWGW